MKTTKNDAAESAAHWRALADEQDRRVLMFPQDHPGAAQSRAAMYRRTAEAIEIGERTGVPHCACCLKPMGRGIHLKGIR